MSSLSRSIVLGFLLLLFSFTLIETASAIPDPSAVYCTEMGYNYTIVKMEGDSEIGYCIFPDNTSCPAWDFYAGTGGQNWSYCAKNGLLTIAMTDGNDPYSPVYSACAKCVHAQYHVPKCAVKAESNALYSSNADLRIVGSVSELMNLSEKLGCMCSLEIENLDGEEQKECKEDISQIVETTSLSSEFDWRNYNRANWVTPVKAQGSCGSCWAFASNGGVEAMINIIENDPYFDIDLSEQYLVSDCSNAGSCCGGIPSQALDYIKDEGVPDECCFPYADGSCSCDPFTLTCNCRYSNPPGVCSDKQCSDKCGDSDKRLWKIDEYKTINANDIKKYLVAFGPIVTCMYWEGDASDRWDSNGVYNCSALNRPNHAILIVGYNDNDAGGYWIVKNSWGANWGPDSNGFFRLGYGECGLGSVFGSQYIHMLKRSPEKTTAEHLDVTTGSSSGSLSDTHTKYGDYLTLDEQCGLIGCDGLASDFTFTLPTDYIFDNLDVVAHLYSSESGFDLFVWNVQTSDWEYLADVPGSCDSDEFGGSSTIHWHMVKYGICNSEEECRKYIDSNGHLKLNFAHESCTLCDRDIINIDWLFLWKKAHFSINVTPEKEGYEPGETAKVTIDVTNNGDRENIWLGVSFKDPAGDSAKYDPQITITPESADIGSGDTETFTAEWTIPNDAPGGQYQIAVNCWEDDTFTNRYTDDLEWEPIFYVFNIDIISPTTSSPVIVGDPSTPAEFNAEVSTGIPFILAFPGAFNAMIGGKPAGVTVIPSFFDNAFGYYTLQITPPTQDTEGSYDLNIGFSLGEVSDYDVEPDAVIYSTGGNIDVVEVIDRSGSMQGEPIQVAKDSAKLFVDLMKANDMIGVASYSSGARVDYGLSEITGSVPSTVKVLMNDDSVVTMDLDEYLKGVVTAEMYPNWPIEALKAQAVASRSFAIANTHHDHINEDVCTDYNCCQAWMAGPYDENVEKAVTETHNEVLTYNGQIAKEALFFAHCNGNTRNSEDYCPGGNCWNYVSYLRSVACDCGCSTYDGHGVGMCQYGAKARAEQGHSYVDILKHYYTGIDVASPNAVKENAKDAIDGISAGGMTSIGAGLQAAYNELVDKGDPSHPHSIVLMSDGWHNTAPHPDTVLPDIRNANIRVFTIGLGAGADASLLSHIAHDSGCGGGEYYYSPGSGELSAIYNAIAGVVKAESTVKTVTGSVQQDETITHKVDIDPTIDIVTFTVTWTSGTLNLELERPDGSKVDLSDPDVISHTKEATYETYTMDSPMVGEWTMEITAPSTSSSAETTISDLTNAGEGVTANKADSSDDDWSTEIDVSAIVKSAQKAVTSQAGISYTAAVTATTNLTMHIYTDKDQYSLNEPMRIITALTKAGSPVTGADVNVTIERPDAAKDYLSLYDDGKHDDGVALDGVYANYYTNTGMSGSYTITVHASGTASPEEFTREVKKSVYVSGVSTGEISVTLTSWDTGIVHLGGDTISAFTVSSTSTKDETVMISATDLADGHGNVIGSENVIGMPSTFVVPAGGSVVFYERIYVPETAKTGTYTGSVVLTSTANSVNIPVTLQAEKLFETDLPNIELVYADPTVTNINVTGLNLSEINETYKPEECITPQSAYMIDSTGSGNFTLRFTDISDADSILVYKIDPSSTPPDQWILLDATTTADTVTFTMEVGDPPVVFCSGAPTRPAPVPSMTPVGIAILIGSLSLLAVGRIRRRFN